MKIIYLLTIILIMKSCGTSKEQSVVIREYHDDNTILAEDHYKLINGDTILHGPSILYNINGGKMYESLYFNGKKTVTRGFYPDGWMFYYAFMNFLNNKLIYEVEFDKTGKIVKEFGMPLGMYQLLNSKSLRYHLGDTLKIAIFVATPDIFHHALSAEIITSSATKSKTLQIQDTLAILEEVCEYRGEKKIVLHLERQNLKNSTEKKSFRDTLAFDCY